jgi:hypothetical protein
VNRYIRITSTKNVPRHRFIKYIYYLGSESSKTIEEYIDTVKFEKEQSQKKKWVAVDRAEAIEALEWLIENNLVKVVE